MIKDSEILEQILDCQAEFQFVPATTLFTSLSWCESSQRRVDMASYTGKAEPVIILGQSLNQTNTQNYQ